MIHFLFWLFFFPSRADVILVPKFEGVGSQKGTLASREMAKFKIDYLGGAFGFYLEGFAEAENDSYQREVRRLAHRGYLQEAYFEARLQRFFLRAGVQAQRWSEMWATPSLDVWTGRRWNRLYLDPLSEQLTHPSGILLSYGGEAISLDLMLVDHSGENFYPEPLPERGSDPDPTEELYGGVRLRTQVGGLGFSVVAAKADRQDLVGLGANYAWAQWVSKVEYGSLVKKEKSLYSEDRIRDYFVSLGGDIFLDKWTLQPQMTYYNLTESDFSLEPEQSLFYLSGVYASGKLEVQFQGTWNIKTEDTFESLLLGWNWSEMMTSSVFVQNYSGAGTALTRVYQDLTGGLVAGVRIEMNLGAQF